MSSKSRCGYLLLEMVQWTDELESAWERYADSHFVPPANPNSERLIDQLVSLKPMQHNRETFRKELTDNKKFLEKWMRKTTGKKQGHLFQDT